MFQLISIAMRMFFLFLALLFMPSLYAQVNDDASAAVNKVDDFPIFIYSKPVDSFIVVGNAISFSDAIKILANENNTFDQKIESIIVSSIKRKEKGKIGDYNAILFDSEKEKVLAINFVEKPTVNANVETIDSIHVFFYSTPQKDYKVVDTLVADYSLYAKRNGVFAKIDSMVRRTKKKQLSGEIDDFDAIIIDSKDLSETLIKFDN